MRKVFSKGPKLISIILAAGSGIRMRPLSYFIPKVLLPVRGRPVLDYLMRNMQNLDIETHYIIASEHLETIERYAQTLAMDNVKVIRALGWETGGDLSLGLEQIGIEDHMLVMNGDIVTDLDYSNIWKDHQKLGGLATLGILDLENEEDAKRFGQIKLDEKNKILSFDEKNKSPMKGHNLVNTGFYLFDKELIRKRSEYLVPRKFKLENELFPKLSKEGKLFGSISEIKYWWDVGTMDSYLKTEEFLINSERIVPP